MPDITKDLTQNENQETTETTNTESENGKSSGELDYAKLINEAVAKAVAEQLKQFQPGKTEVKPIEPAKKNEAPSIDYEAKFAEMEKRLSEKYEKNAFISTLSQDQLTFLQEIDGYEGMSVKALKKILSKTNSNPDITVSNKPAQTSDLDKILAELRPDKK